MRVGTHMNKRLILFNDVNDRNSIAAIKYTASYSTKSDDRYQLKGALYWFPCDEYGVQTAPALFIMRVPFRIGARMAEEKRVKALRERMESANLAYLFTKATKFIKIEQMNTKPYFWSFECPTKEDYYKRNKVEDTIESRIFRK